MTRHDSKRKGPVVHIRKFDDGRRTPQEYHAQFAFKPGTKCVTCGGPPMARIRVFASVDELKARAPQFLLAIASASPFGAGQLPTVPTKYGPMVKVSETVFCKSCTPQAERHAARGPSWMLVEINRGPDADKMLTQVPG